MGRLAFCCSKGRVEPERRRVLVTFPSGIAQFGRAVDSESIGRRFNSCFRISNGAKAKDQRGYGSEDV